MINLNLKGQEEFLFIATMTENTLLCLVRRFSLTNWNMGTSVKFIQDSSRFKAASR